PRPTICRRSRIASSAGICDHRDGEPRSARRRPLEATVCREWDRRERFRSSPRGDERVARLGAELAERRRRASSHRRRSRAGGASRPPLVILVPGLDSVKEELYAMENDFLRRGLATLTIDGPGQGENAPRFPIRPDWSTVITPLLDHLAAHERGLDLGRIGIMGISMGGIYGPRAAAKEKRLRAIVALAGPYDLSEC